MEAPRSPRVVVIGAGFAGLAAAFTLAGRAVDVVVMEGRDRVGGRVHTVPVGDSIGELGAEWIEADDETLHGLARDVGVPLVEAGIDYRRRTPFGPGGALLEEQDELVAAARDLLAATSEHELRGRTLGSFIDNLPGSERQRRTLRMRLQGTFARDLGSVALRQAAVAGSFRVHPGPYYRAATGNQSIAEGLAAALADVRLGHLVEDIEINHEGVRVRGTSPDGPFDIGGTVVIVAAPATIVPGIRFAPPMPDDQREAYEKLPFGRAAKLLVATEGPPALRARQNVEAPFWCYAALGGAEPRPVITSFAGSKEGLETLGVLSGDLSTWWERVRNMNEDVTFAGEPITSSWHDDPLCRGSYSVFDDASMDRAGVLARPFGRILFCGEHTGGPWSGTMEGAARSGLRAAREVMDLLSR